MLCGGQFADEELLLLRRPVPRQSFVEEREHFVPALRRLEPRALFGARDQALDPLAVEPYVIEDSHRAGSHSALEFQL
jgi:hypothetical protein